MIVRTESATPHDRETWKALTDGMGLAGLAVVPEERGGQGATHREVAVVLEELGRAVAPVPYLTSAVVATEALLACAADDPLAQLASGRTIGALAVALHGTGCRLPVRTTGERHAARGADRDRRRGRRRRAARPGRGRRAVRGRRGRRDRHPAGGVGSDPTAATVTFDAQRPAGSATPNPPYAGPRTAAGLLASEQLGLAEWALTETVRYLKERKQFNRPVGGFQALKHRLAQLWLEVVSLRAAARGAADALATGEDVDVAVAVAQAYAAPVAVRAAEEARTGTAASA
ncbi:Acyl-CoA dehydrogenase OS=Streptomyces alboniger OX=132473 GN=CP975_03755 PE=3 SV=1 [Streptomyces alboniger]